ncbi:lipopolysaccharide biosynthesis protein [Tsuneonella sp. HG222]
MPAKAEDSASPGKEPPSLLRRMLANTAWLLGGKGFGAVCSLIYLAILARSLGLKDFGHFSLIFGAAQALIALAGFESWRIVVRYGAAHVHAKDWAAFGRLGLLAGLLDLIGAILGTAAAWVIIYGFGESLGLNPDYGDVAFWFTCAMLFALVSAPTGIVRALDRFDVAVYVEALVPTGRLLAALAIWLTGPTLVKFLIAWALVDLIEAAAYWFMARRLCPEAITPRHLAGWRKAQGENPGIRKFFVVNYASATLDAAFKQGPLLAVGYLLGTRAAGLFRMAAQLSQGLGKVSTLLTRAAYAEINRARVAADLSDFRKLVISTSALAAGAGALVVLLAVLLGRPILDIIGGANFQAAYVILIPLTVAASLELASVAFEPVLHSTGQVHRALIGRMIGVAVMTLAIALSAGSDDPSLIGWHVALGAVAMTAALGLMTWGALRRLTPGEPSPAVPPA